MLSREWPLDSFFPRLTFLSRRWLEERVSNHRHQRMTMKAVPRPSLEVVEPEFLLQLSLRVLAV